MEIKLGAVYQDKINGLRGTATGHVDYLTGCSQTLITPRSEDPGVYIEPCWIDDTRLMLVSFDERFAEEFPYYSNRESTKYKAPTGGGKLPSFKGTNKLP